MMGLKRRSGRQLVMAAVTALQLPSICHTHNAHAHARTHTNTQAHTRARTHTHTRTRTQTHKHRKCARARCQAVTVAQLATDCLPGESAMRARGRHCQAVTVAQLECMVTGTVTITVTSAIDYSS